jgi:hypothetical protein
MPRRRFGEDADAADVAPAIGFKPFDGPLGVYRGMMKQLAITKTSTNKDQLVFVWECEESGDKARHNGGSLWGRQTITKAGAMFVNGFLVALGATQADIRKFWGNNQNDGPMLEKPDRNKREKVLSIGSLKINAAGMPLVVNIGMDEEDPENVDPKTGRPYPAKIAIKSFLAPETPGKPAARADDRKAAAEEDAEADAITSAAQEEDEEEAAPAAATPAEEEEEEEEAAEDPNAAFNARAAELEQILATGGRVAIRTIAKDGDHGLTVYKTDADADIIDKILDHEFPPPADGAAAEEEEEEAAAPPATAPKTAPKTRTTTKAAVDDEPPF